MIYILLFLLILLSLFYYILFCKDILSPSFIATLMFTVSTFVASLNVKKWGFSFDGFTVIVVITTLLSMGFGEVIVRLNFRRVNAKSCLIHNKRFILKRQTIFVLFLFFFIGLMGYIYSTIEMAKLSGWRGGKSLITYAHYTRLHPEIYKVLACERIFTWWKNICKIFVYTISFFFLNEILIYKRIRISYLIFLFLYFCFIVFSGGRTELIYIFVFWVFIGICFYMQTQGWNTKKNIKIFKALLLVVFLFFSLFLLSGSFRDSISGKIWRVLSLYVGESIPLLDNYFMYPRPADSLFGENTLFGIYRFLRKFTNAIPILYAPYDFTIFDNGESGNVYTMIRRYHEDFGFLGLYTLSCFLGFIYSFFLLVVRNRRDWKIIIYAMSLAPIVEISIEERFFMSVIDVGNITILILSVFIFLLLSGSFNQSRNLLFQYRCKRN